MSKKRLDLQMFADASAQPAEHHGRSRYDG